LPMNYSDLMKKSNLMLVFFSLFFKISRF